MFEEQARGLLWLGLGAQVPFSQAARQPASLLQSVGLSQPRHGVGGLSASCDSGGFLDPSHMPEAVNIGACSAVTTQGHCDVLPMQPHSRGQWKQLNGHGASVGWFSPLSFFGTGKCSCDIERETKETGWILVSVPPNLEAGVGVLQYGGARQQLGCSHPKWPFRQKVEQNTL